MENISETFKLLRRLSEKRVRYRHHLSNYKTYRENNTVLKGLKITVPTGLPLSNKDTRLHWKGILKQASLQLMSVQIGNCRKVIQDLTQQIDSTTRKLQQATPRSELKNKIRIISQDCTKLSHTLSSRQQEKFVRDEITSNQVTRATNCVAPDNTHRSRRFIRKSVEPTDTTHSVVAISCELSDEEIEILSKGLNFCPKPKQVDAQKLSLDLEAFFRRLRLREFFADEDGNSSPNPVDNISAKFKSKSTWNPPKDHSSTLESYISAIKEDVKNYIPPTEFRDNLSKTERQTIGHLRHRDDIVVKPADKGSAVVAMSTEFYESEAKRLLDNPLHYQRLDSDPTQQIAARIETTIKNMVSKGSIRPEVGPNLLQPEPKPGRFYFLPKIHKDGNPGRPIISGNSTATEKISKFVDLLIQPLVPSLSSHVKDTTDFIRKTEKIKELPPGTLLATLDVSSLYTNIPHKEGIAACTSAFKPIPGQTPTKTDLAKLMRLILTCNNFVFGTRNYLQIHGTAMGTKMAPSFANLFMGSLEKEFLAQQALQPHLWLRYIDDIFMIWTHGEEKLTSFIEQINSFHPSIKFTADFSHSSVHFLDTTVTLKDGSLKTDLFTKPTDKHNFLLPSSCHPPHCTKNIPYSQALRLRRICSSDSDFELRARDLSKHLQKRQYFRSSIEEAIEKARKTPRVETLTYKTRQSNSRVPLVCEYHPALPPLASFIHKHLPILHSQERLKSVFPEPPVLAYSRPRNLRDILVTAKFSDKSEPQTDITGSRPCSSNCKTCKLVDCTNSFKSFRTSRKYPIQQDIHCLSKNLVYLIYCNLCGVQYIGESQNTLRQRMTGHRSAIKTKKFQQPVARHFNMADHSIENLRVIGIEQNNSWPSETRKARENYWELNLKTTTPFGLNIRNDLPTQ